MRSRFMQHANEQTELMARLAALDNTRAIIPDAHWRNENTLSTSYGDWSDHKGELTADAWLLLERTGYSDYSGSIVEASNHKVIE